MKTIDERAKEWGEHIVETTTYDVVDGKACVFVEDRNIADVAEESYIVGANAQKAIDIEKACEWFADYLMDIGYPDDWMRDSPNMESGEERFIKAMVE